MPVFAIPTQFDDKHVSRLRRSLEQSRRDLQSFRQFRRTSIAEYVGFHFGSGVKKRVVSNMIELMVNTFSRQLSASVPKVLVSSFVPRLAISTQKLELAMNHLLGEINFGRTHRRWVKDALFALSIIKTGNRKTGELPEETEGWIMDVGQPFAETIDLDDWVHDTNARVWEELQYCGHKFRWPMDLAKKVYGSKLKDVEESDLSDRNEDGDERVSAISHNEKAFRDSYRKHVDLYEIYLPFDRVIATFRSKEEGDPFGAFLGVKEYEGPERGPYVPLSFAEVPGQIMPVTPVITQFDWHRFINVMYRKIFNQAERQKTILGYARGAGTADGERIKNANDGDVIAMDHPDNTREFSTGGVDAGLVAIAQHAFDRFMTHSGNLDALAGLQPQSPTLGQDELLNANASKRVQDMQDQVINATTDVIKSLAWHLIYNPLIELPLTVEIGSRSSTFKFTQDDIEGDFLDYNFNIDPYSMQHRSPSSRSQQLLGLFQNIFFPGAQDMASQGIGVDWMAIIDLLGKDFNLPELKKVLRFINPPGGQEQVGRSPIRQSPVTTRINQRVNTTNNDRQAKDSFVSQLLSSVGGDQ